MCMPAGPFPKYDAERGIYVHVFTARPIPTGMTVIATPLRPNNTANNNNNVNAATENNLNPPPTMTTNKVGNLNCSTRVDPGSFETRIANKP